MEGSGFRGEGGDVVRGFLTFGTFLTAIPVGAAALLLAVLASACAERFHLPAVVAVPAFLSLLAPVTGLFALAARRGQAQAGFLDALGSAGARHVLGFSLRYGAMQCAWSIPLVLLARKVSAGVAAGMAAGPGSQLTLAAWAVASVASACLLLPTLTLLVATKAESMREAFSARAWSWLLAERRNDLVAYVALAVGGMTLFIVAALPLLALVLPVAADLAPRASEAMVTALPILPAATVPVLLGRLAGAFVACEPLVETATAGDAAGRTVGRRSASSTFDVPVPEPSRTVAALAGIPRGHVVAPQLDCPTSVQPARQGAAQGVPLGVALARAHQQAESDVAGSLSELEALRAANPRNPAVVAELARVLRKAGRQDDAREAAGVAIRLALSGGAGPIAHDVFRAFASEAAHLHLEPAVYEQLARILSARREYDGAAWCYRAAAALGGDPRTLQKGMLAVAETALHGGEAERAAAVYEAFVKTWPDSPLARFARDGAEAALRKAGLTTLR